MVVQFICVSLGVPNKGKIFINYKNMKHLITKHPLIDSVVEQSAPYVAECVESFIVWHSETNDKLAAKGKNQMPDLTERDLENYGADIKIAMIKALGNYTLATDVLKSVNFSWANYKGVSISLKLERDGNIESIRTESIIAEGEVQRRHVRYIVHTNLKKLGVDLTKRLSKLDTAQDNVNRWIKYVERLENELVEYQSKTLETVTAKHFSYHLERGIAIDQIWNSFPQSTRDHYVTEEAYFAPHYNEIELTMKHIPKRISGLKAQIKKEKVTLEKYQNNLAALLAAK